MSIATELAAIKNSVTSIYNKIQERGGIIPAKKNLANVSSAVESIPDRPWNIKHSEKVQAYSIFQDIAPQTLVKFVNGAIRKVNHIIMTGTPLGAGTSERLYMRNLSSTETNNVVGGFRGAIFPFTGATEEENRSIIFSPLSWLATANGYGIIMNVIDPFNIDTLFFTPLNSLRKSNTEVSTNFRDLTKIIEGVYLGLFDYSSDSTNVTSFVCFKYLDGGSLKINHSGGGCIQEHKSGKMKKIIHQSQSEANFLTIGKQNYGYYKITNLDRANTNMTATKIYYHNIAATLFNQEEVRDFYVISRDPLQVHVITNLAEYDLIIDSNANTPTKLYSYQTEDGTPVDLKEVICYLFASDDQTLCRYTRTGEGIYIENILGIKKGNTVYPLLPLGTGKNSPQFLREDYILGIDYNIEDEQFYVVIVSNALDKIRYNIYTFDFDTKTIKFVDSVASKAETTDIIRDNDFSTGGNNHAMYIKDNYLYFTDCQFINGLGTNNSYKDSICAEYICYNLDPNVQYSVEEITEGEVADAITQSKCTTTSKGSVWTVY